MYEGLLDINVESLKHLWGLDRTGVKILSRQHQTENLTHSLKHHFETIPNSKKLQMTTEMWLLKDFKIQIT